MIRMIIVAGLSARKQLNPAFEAPKVNYYYLKITLNFLPLKNIE